MGKEELSGSIRLVKDRISYSAGWGNWEVPVKNVRVIGEHTNDHGPGADDYFFVFLTADMEFEASFYAAGRDLMLRNVGKILGHELKCGLVDSTSFKSRVMWPPEIEGQPLFDYKTKSRRGFLWARIKDWIIPLVEYRLTEGVKARLIN